MQRQGKTLSDQTQAVIPAAALGLRIHLLCADPGFLAGAIPNADQEQYAVLLIILEVDAGLLQSPL